MLAVRTSYTHPLVLRRQSTPHHTQPPPRAMRLEGRPRGPDSRRVSSWSVCFFSQSGNGPLSPPSLDRTERGTHDGATQHNCCVYQSVDHFGRNSGPGRCFLFPPALGRGPNNWPTQAPTTLSAALCSGLPFCLLLGERWALPVQMVICPHHRDATMSVVAPCDNGGAESPLLGLLLLPPLLRGDGMTNPP